MKKIKCKKCNKRLIVEASHFEKVSFANISKPARSNKPKLNLRGRRFRVSQRTPGFLVKTICKCDGVENVYFENSRAKAMTKARKQ